VVDLDNARGTWQYGQDRSERWFAEKEARLLP